MFMLIEKSVIIEHKLPIKEHSRLKIYRNLRKCNCKNMEKTIG